MTTENNEIISKLTDHIEEVVSEYEVVLCYLYGSYATDSHTPLSDIDVGILFHESVDRSEYPSRMLKIMGELDRIIRKVDVDVSVLNDAPVELRYNVIAEGKLIYCADESIRIKFETTTIRDYLDFKPILDTYYRYIRESYEELDSHD